MKHAVAVLVVLGLGIVLAGCATAASVNIENHGRFGEQIRVPAKDFESRGLVFAEFQHEVISGRGVINGETFTFQALLREAQLLGADAIINVVIDKRIDRVTTGQITTVREIWSGSALAISYTDTLTVSSTTTVISDLSTTTTTHHNVIMNDGREFTADGGGAAAPAGQPADTGRRGLLRRR